MWNYNIRPGAIWSTKSFNAYEANYVGMTGGEQKVLILSTYTDEAGIEKFTYTKIENRKTKIFSVYIDILIDDIVYYINIDNIYTRR